MVEIPASIARLPFVTPDGESLAHMDIVPQAPNSLYILDAVSADTHGEAAIQIVEGRGYEYRLDAPAHLNLRLREHRALTPSALHPGSGRLDPCLHTGRLRFELMSGDSGSIPVAAGEIEVRSAKLDYRRDYRMMLDAIAERAVGLLTDIRTPAMTRLQPDANAHPGDTPATLHQRLAFIAAMLQSREFKESIARITAAPDRARVPIPEFRDIRHGGRPTRASLASLARNPRRAPAPPGHPLATLFERRGLPGATLPADWQATRHVDTFDTPANRFARFALLDFGAFLADAASRLDPSTPEGRQWATTIRHLQEHIAATLARAPFSDARDGTTLALGNPALQRKGGYREMLGLWVRFRMAARLAWAGGDAVYGAGKRDIAQLYEYWLFFVMLDVFRSITGTTPAGLDDLIGVTDNGFDLRLAAGSTFAVEGIVSGCDAPMRARFSYNRLFAGTAPNRGPSSLARGSWTRAMRPDYTLSFWPATLTEGEAADRDRLVHLHFDAKYRVEQLAPLFGTDDPSEMEDDDRPGVQSLAAQRADLLKMHAYRDAIRRTQGAYVLYPGLPGDSTQWIEYNELLPGLGAFAVLPGHADASLATLQTFIADVVRLLCSDAPDGLP